MIAFIKKEIFFPLHLKNDTVKKKSNERIFIRILFFIDYIVIDYM